VRIVSVHLKNIKSHRDTALTFSPGINVLSGANGSGKSTIFQAIGYALFGVSAQDFASRADRFLTIGTKRGEVSVVFEPSEGELYRVTRTVGPAGKWLLAKETGGDFETEEHANSQETEQRIASLLGLSGGRPLADQFKLVIGPFQNDFLGPFVIKQPTRRQDAFDEILGIDAWRKTFEGTKTLASTILGKIETLQAETDSKMEQVAVLPAKELELKGLRESESAKRLALEQRKVELDRVKARVASLDAHKEQIDLLQSALQELEARIASGKEHVATQQLLADQSKTAAAVLAASSDGKKKYDAAEMRLKALQGEQQQKLLIERKLAELDKEHSGIRAALGIETRELGELRSAMEADAGKVAEEERSLATEQAELKQRQAAATEVVGKANQVVELFKQLPVHRIENVLPYLSVALDRMAALDARLNEMVGVVEGGAALKAEGDHLRSRQAELERIQAERSELGGRRSSLIEGCEKIGAGDCPFLHEPCKNVEAGGGVEILTARIAAIDTEIVRLDADAKVAAANLASAQAAAQQLAGVEQVRLELEKVRRERDAVDKEFARKLAEIEPAILIAAVQKWLESVGMAPEFLKELHMVALTLAGAPEERRAQLLDWSDRWRGVLVSIEQALAARVKEAETPLQQCTVKSGELSSRAKVVEGKKRELATTREKALQREKAIQAHQGRLDVLLRTMTEQKEAFAAFAGVEDAIKAAGAELEQFRPDRDRFIANEKDAAELEMRLERLGKYQERLQALERDKTARGEEFQKLSASYDAEQHDAAKKERDLLVSAVATLTAEIAGIGEGVIRLQGEIAALTVIATEIRKKLSAIEELKKQGELVKFLRNQVFRNVSSQLSERFREEISFRADRIYRCISEADEELYWGENYQVVLKDMVDDQIRERTDDQLSGGQMMSAVVALRLALLQTIGARIAFFDEPTSNLDAERRENLAKAFRAIDVGQEEVTEHWYDQLFLVSHDVSFTEITDQMIHLE
jgi:DNA repair protein SbcC/Rad50